jgi:hypothetical protein
MSRVVPGRPVIIAPHGILALLPLWARFVKERGDWKQGRGESFMRRDWSIRLTNILSVIIS